MGQILDSNDKPTLHMRAGYATSRRTRHASPPMQKRLEPKDRDALCTVRVEWCLALRAARIRGGPDRVLFTNLPIASVDTHVASSSIGSEHLCRCVRLGLSCGYARGALSANSLCGPAARCLKYIVIGSHIKFLPTFRSWLSWECLLANLEASLASKRGARSAYLTRIGRMRMVRRIRMRIVAMIDTFPGAGTQ